MFILTILNKAKCLLMCICIFIVLTPIYVSANNDVLNVRYNQFTFLKNDSAQQYFSALLKIALDETVDDFGPYQLLPVNIDMVQQRTI